MIIDAQGKLLVAPPGMPDPRFRKTVVFIWRHDVSGAAGVIINKRCQRPTFDHICREGSITLKSGVNPPVYYGGPVLNNVVGVLHSTEYRLASTNTLIDDTVGFTLDSKILEDVAQGNGPLNRMITLGMANWETGQLEAELDPVPPRPKTMSWLIIPYDNDIIFNTKPEEIWELCVNRAVADKTKEITSKVFKA